MMIPTTLGLLLPAFPPEQRPVAIGIWSAVSGVAAALGPPIGGLLVQISWHWIFLVNVPIGLITVFAAIAHPRRGRRNPTTAAPTCSARSSSRSASASSPSASSRAPNGAGATAAWSARFVAAVALVAAFLYRSAHHRAPVIELPLLRVRSFALANLATLVFFMGFGAMLLSGVLLLTEVWGWSELRAGFALSPVR